MSTFKLAAIKVLKKHNKPLHYEKITDLAVEENLIDTVSKNPQNTMSAVITTSIKNDKKSPFRKTGKGTYALNPDYADAEQDEEKKELEEEKLKGEELANQFTGTAGEHIVIGELLLRGYNANKMSVDGGIDVVAIKDNNTFYIQIKTSNEHKCSRYVSDIRISSYKKFRSANTFYIFVLRNKKQEVNFLILPYTKIQENIDEKNILVVAKNKKYRVTVILNEKETALGKKSNSVKYYKNNWDLLK